MGDRRIRIDLVQGDAKRLDFEVVKMSPTAGATAYNLASLATAYLNLRLQPSGLGVVSAPASVVSASGGALNVTVGTAHTASPGNYQGELVLDFGPGIGRESVPKDNPFEVIIRASV